jgi:DNA-directed RNA polymerase specialized sigma24 family protein
MAPPTVANDAHISEADDRALAEACGRGEEAAFEELLARHGRLVRAVVIRTIDERRGGTMEELPACVDAVLAHVRREGFEAWSGRSTLRHYLAVVTRQQAVTYLQDVTPAGTLAAALPPPSSLFLDQVLAEEPAKRVATLLERQPPNVGGLARLRLRGMSCSFIGATLGIGTDVVRGHLDRVAAKLGELGSTTDEQLDTTRAWRMLLDAAPVEERVETALRTADEEKFRGVRSVVESTFRAVRERELDRLHPKTPDCLDEATIAAFVDGSIRGPERTRAEGHVGVCPRCIDTVSQLAMDVRTLEPLKDAASQPDEVALAAACIATARYRAGELLADQAVDAGAPMAGTLVRLARVGSSLVLGHTPAVAVETSRVVTTRLPTDEEAPIVALEALVTDDPHGAARAIDDELARGSLGMRLRLLAAAAGDDPAGARDLATQVIEKHHSDPGLVADAKSALALPPGRSLPREIVVERVRDTIPAAVRHVLTR